jgi:outer membrane protein
MPGHVPSIRRFLLTEVLLFGLAGSGAAFPAAAEDLLQVYREAQRADAAYAAAKHALDAGREKDNQGLALLLPNLNLTGSATRTRVEVDSRDPLILPSFTRYPESASYTLTFTQPIFRAQNWLQYQQGGFQVRQAEATFGQATQDLIVRVAQAYFDVLAANDTLALVRAQKTATAEQLAQAKRNFEVGTATITDTHEAQARYDLIAAQEIAALNDVETKRRALQLITGKEPGELTPLRADVRLSPPTPADMQAWVELAEKQGYPVQIQEAAAEVASLEARRNRAAHLPTLDFVATHGQSGQNATTDSLAGRDTTTTVIGLQLAMPLYQGGGISSREREAAALSLKAKEDLESARRNSALAARQNYLLVANGIAVVSALEQALVSSQSALDSNKLGYEVGVRINIDVLNAQQQVFQTRRDLAVARYNTITNSLRLRAASATLREEDLELVNRALAH